MKNTPAYITVEKDMAGNGKMGTIVYGLPNCDSTQAVMKWFAKKGMATTLHNFKTDSIRIDKVKEWCKKLGWEKVLNKRSTTWRGLSKSEQDAVVDEATAMPLLLNHTSLIKRPVIESGKELMIGFDEKKLSDIFR